MVNAYVLDPAHIAPSRSDANSNGHFPNNNASAMGTPRGFNLSSLPVGYPQSASNMPNPAAFQAFMAQYGVPPPAGFGVNFAEDGQVGGPRRNNGRFNSRAAGPDDRQPKDARNARWANGGRLSPPPKGRGNPKWGGGYADGGTAGTVGPKEAVQGRSIKSYEDLDAAGGSGTGELNY